MCTDGLSQAFVLLGSSNGLFASGATSSISVNCPGLADSTASQMELSVPGIPGSKAGLDLVGP